VARNFYITIKKLRQLSFILNVIRIFTDRDKAKLCFINQQIRLIAYLMIDSQQNQRKLCDASPFFFGTIQNDLNFDTFTFNKDANASPLFGRHLHRE
jgi:hypothetical protein